MIHFSHPGTSCKIVSQKSGFSQAMRDFAVLKQHLGVIIYTIRRRKWLPENACGHTAWVLLSRNI